MKAPRQNLNKPGGLINLYQPLPWQIAPWRDRSPVVLLAGPAGTGKSKIAAEKLHGYLLKYPDATGLALRKTRQSMINSTVLFLDRSVIGRDKRVTHVKSANRFEYWNGSILAYGGMADEEQREQVRGIGIDGGVDFCWMEEGIKFVEDDYQEIMGRMRGTAAPWQQILLATNPGPPSHWINQRLILGGEASVYDKARPEDNPFNPRAYIEGLQRLTGILRMRLWEGKWCQAEGLVYSDFDIDNLTDEEPDPDLPFELGIDDGYVDPRAILFVQKKGTEVLVFDEIYESRKLAETHVKQVLTWCLQRSPKDEPAEWRQMGLETAAQWCRANEVRLPEIAIYSPNATELRGRLRLADIPARKADDDVIQGISTVRELILDGNGVRTLKVHRRCKNFIKELTEGYVYPEGNRKDNEKPKDGNDHACFVAGTIIETIDGSIPIEQIKQGDLVLTRNGYKPVIASGITKERAKVITAIFSNGSMLTGTPNHPVFVRGKEYIEMRALRYSDIIETSDFYLEASRWQRVKLLFTRALNFAGIPTQGIGLTGGISDRTPGIFETELTHFTAKSGRIISGLFQMGITSIIKIITRSTIPWKISNALRVDSTLSSTEKTCQRRGEENRQSASTGYVTWLRSGITRPKQVRCTKRSEKEPGKTQPSLRLNANTVDRYSKRLPNTGKLGSVRIIANLVSVITQTQIMRLGSALDAALNSLLTSTRKNVSVPVSVLCVIDAGEVNTVFNLTVDNTVGEYFANGVLSHNCEGFRYWAHMRAR